jgi:hypothetical protein
MLKEIAKTPSLDCPACHLAAYLCISEIQDIIISLFCCEVQHVSH